MSLKKYLKGCLGAYLVGAGLLFGSSVYNGTSGNIETVQRAKLEAERKGALAFGTYIASDISDRLRNKEYAGGLGELVAASSVCAVPLYPLFRGRKKEEKAQQQKS